MALLFFLLLFAAAVVLAASPCSEGLGEMAPNKTSGVEELDSSAVESPLWFFRRFVGPARPVLLRRAGGPGELWSDLFLLHKMGSDATVRVTTLRRSDEAKKKEDEKEEKKEESLGRFLGRYLQRPDVVMRASLPESLHIGPGEVERVAVPCLEEGVRVGLVRELVVGAGGGMSSNLEAVARDMVIRVVAGERVFRVGPPGSERGRRKREKSGEWEAEAFESFGEVVVRKDEALFVPALWFRQSSGHCRHLSVETSFDVRRLTRPPFLETWLNSRRSLDAIYAQMLRLQVEESGSCPSLDTPSDHTERKAAWKRRALVFTALGVVVVGVAMVQVVRGMRADAIEKKNK